MKRLSSSEIRQMWFDFWESKGHKIIPSASLIPHKDPTLLWINAGVTPLKKYFDGSEVPESRRMAGSQKCIRTNDIENVGKTARHHTFFEMLGNFSVGDYFKKDAITWAWEFLTSPDWLFINKDKLYITVYTDDTETYELWKSLGVEESHLVKLDSNFWCIGAGPSGPDSEIFFDRGESYDKDHLGIELLEKEIENDRYIEIWNNVFSQYNAKPGIPRNEYPELPSKNIDTGMGLERITAILRDADTNFDTDLFLPIIEKVEDLSGAIYTGDIAFKVIADHIRTITFALSDGASFGNTGRSYVLRRLLRRAVRYGKILGMERPFLYELVPTVVDIMKQHYAYLLEEQAHVMEQIKKEEEIFLKTLQAGEKRLNELFTNSTSNEISGKEAFKLYDTYGFPFELTLEYADELGFTVSRDEFEEEMKKQKEMAKASRGEFSSMNIQNEALLSFDEPSEFVGYEELKVEATIIKLFDGESFVPTLTGEGYIVLDKTPFYAESGGQVSDTGVIVDNDITLEVEDLLKGPNKQHFHYVKFEGIIHEGDRVIAEVNEINRMKIMCNHSAAHLLQKSLREILGDKVHQAGSKVDEEMLRFDFTYDGKISKNEVVEIENRVNEKIKSGVASYTEIMSLEDAKKTGAMALFDEKYGEKVRVVHIADSKELCGGTHVLNSADIGSFAIKSLESKGSNVYRMVGVTGEAIGKSLFEVIKPYNDTMNQLLEKAKKIVEDAHLEDISLNLNMDNLNISHDAPVSYRDIISNMNELELVKYEISRLEKEYHEKKSEKALSNLSIFYEQKEEINGIQTIIMKVYDYELSILKQIIDRLLNELDCGFVFLANVKGTESVNYLAKESESLKDRFQCGILVRKASMTSKGNGGGSPLFAQGGGTDVTNVDNIVQKIKNIVKGTDTV